MNYVQKASTLTKDILKNSPGKCKKVAVHLVKVNTLYIKTFLSGVDILREEGPFGEGIFEVLQGRISGY